MTVHSSGHVYLTLKDEKSQMRAIFFNGAAKCRALGLENGSQVEATGKISFYAPRGECQLTLRDLKPLGTGSLQEQFEAMKKRLAAEGLFDPARKKRLPFVPRCIGIITSKLHFSGFRLCASAFSPRRCRERGRRCFLRRESSSSTATVAQTSC